MSYGSSREGDVITYVPQEERGGAGDHMPPAEMGTIRRWLWLYSHELGQNFTLVLLIAIVYQLGSAILIGLRGIKPTLMSGLSSDLLPQILGGLGAVAFAVAMQSFIVAELAQVVWLRRPDKIKVRLMSSASGWWWIMLVTLILIGLVDLFLLFLTITGQNNLSSALQKASQDQMSGATYVLMVFLHLLTALRCASVMRTSTNEENRREIEEHLKAIADEILIDAGESTRAKARMVWETLSVDPRQLLPIQSSVLALISQQHPNLVPPRLGGDSWAYDFRGNTFAALPPDLHQALVQNRGRANSSGSSRRGVVGDGSSSSDFGGRGGSSSNEQNYMWQMHPKELAEEISFNLDTYGKPRFVDVTDPQAPRYPTRRVDFNAVLYDDETPGSLTDQAQAPRFGSGSSGPLSALPGAASGKNNAPLSQMPGFNPNGLPPREMALFAAYLTSVVYPQVNGGSAFPQLPNLSIFQVFEELELLWYYRQWQQQQVPPTQR